MGKLIEQLLVAPCHTFRHALLVTVLVGLFFLPSTALAAEPLELGPSCKVSKALVSVFEKLHPEYYQSEFRRFPVAKTIKPQEIFSYRSTQKNQPSIDLLVVFDPAPNAFALPQNGILPATIIVTSSLIQTAVNESELAFLLAHEMSHIGNDHFAPELSDALLTENQIAHVTRIHQLWEYKADQDALQQIELAGYNPSSSINILLQLREHQMQTSPLLGPSHPSISQRVQALENAVKRSQPKKLATYRQTPNTL